MKKTLVYLYYIQVLVKKKEFAVQILFYVMFMLFNNMDVCYIIIGMIIELFHY